MKPRLAWVLLVCLWSATPVRSLLAAGGDDRQSPEHVPGGGDYGATAPPGDFPDILPGLLDLGPCSIWGRGTARGW